MLGGSLCLARDGGFPTTLHVLTVSGQMSQPSKRCIQSGAVNSFWHVQPTNIAEESVHSESASLVIPKSTVAEKSLVQWLTALLFRAVKKHEIIFTYKMPSILPFTSDTTFLFQTAELFLLEISTKISILGRHWKKNTARKEKNGGPLKTVGNSCIIWSQAATVTPNYCSFLTNQG